MSHWGPRFDPLHCLSCKAPHDIYVWRKKADHTRWTQSLDVACEERDYHPQPRKVSINAEGYCRKCASHLRGDA